LSSLASFRRQPHPLAPATFERSSIVLSLTSVLLWIRVLVPPHIVTTFSDVPFPPLVFFSLPDDRAILSLSRCVWHGRFSLPHPPARGRGCSLNQSYYKKPSTPCPAPFALSFVIDSEFRFSLKWTVATTPPWVVVFFFPPLRHSFFFFRTL